MKAREKSSNTFSNFLDCNSHFSCDKHPFSSHHVGICPHCLNERLMQLVCSDCGERRLSSCCCSEIEIYRNSCSTADVGSVGRMSFLIDNGKSDRKRRSFLRRSSSSNRVGVEKTNGFGRIKRLFMKKRNKERENLEFCDEENRKSGFSDIFGNENGFGPKRNSCQNPMEFERFCSGSVFPIKERDSSGVDESGFIELKLESWYESKQEFCGGRSSRVSDHGGNEKFEAEEILASLKRNGIAENGGGSCRITMSERGLKQGSRRNYNVWKWIFKNGEK